MKSAKCGFVFLMAAGVAVVGLFVYFIFAPVDAESPRRTSKGASVEYKRRASGSGASKRTKKSGSAVRERESRPQRRQWATPEDWFEHLPARERAIAKRIQDAQDADDREAVFAAVDEAAKSQNAEIRQAAVDALSLQGEAAIPRLLQFVADKDEEIAESAFNAWDDAVDSVDGDMAKLSKVKEALEVVTRDDQVVTAVGKIEQFEQPRAIRELAKLAQGNDDIASAARESYENIVGEPFENWAAAELKAIAAEN